MSTTPLAGNAAVALPRKARSLVCCNCFQKLQWTPQWSKQPLQIKQFCKLETDVFSRAYGLDQGIVLTFNLLLKKFTLKD
ncbi:uncharacterized protein V6R79_013501, partial [Siganus canaliculatus]